MKTVLLVCSGMADEPVEQLGGRTPLEVAKTPAMNAMAQEGKVGLTRTIPEGWEPASDVGSMALLGYDPLKHYPGRAPLEAASLGIPLGSQDVAFRCNLVTSDGDRLVDASAGRITSGEAIPLIRQVADRLGSETLTFYPGAQHRHLAVFREPGLMQPLLETRCTSPRDVVGQRISEHRPKGPAGDRLFQLMESSRQILLRHEVNQVRIDLRENPGNMIWLWGQGRQVAWPAIRQRWGVTGSVISETSWARGAGRLAGLEALEVPAAADSGDGNSVGQAQVALESLRCHDFVWVHVAAVDRAAHSGDLRRKISAIERFDREVVGTLRRGVAALGPVRFFIATDHPTPVLKRRHASDAVPFAISGPGIAPDAATRFGETQAKEGGWRVERAHEILPSLMTQKEL